MSTLRKDAPRSKRRKATETHVHLLEEQLRKTEPIYTWKELRAFSYSKLRDIILRLRGPYREGDKRMLLIQRIHKMQEIALNNPIEPVRLFEAEDTSKPHTAAHVEFKTKHEWSTASLRWLAEEWGLPATASTEEYTREKLLSFILAKAAGATPKQATKDKPQFSIPSAHTPRAVVYHYTEDGALSEVIIHYLP